MILTDGIHLVSDSSLEELHAFAQSCGFRRVWFQDHRFPHYDIIGDVLYGNVMEKLRPENKVTAREIVERGLRREVDV